MMEFNSGLEFKCNRNRPDINTTTVGGRGWTGGLCRPVVIAPSRRARRGGGGFGKWTSVTPRGRKPIFHHPSDNKGDGLASQPRRYRVPGQPLLNWHQVGGVSRSPDGLFAQQKREPTKGRPAVRGKGTYGGWSGQHVEEQGTWASRTRKHSKAGYGRPVDRGTWTANTVKRPRQQPAQPQYAN